MKPEALVTRGHAVYTPLSLRGYDLLVHGFNNHALWACPTRVLEAWVQQHLSARHLDVGVGTGLLLDRATFPSPSPELVLADLSAGSLGHCAARLARYHPRTVRANVLEPLPLPDGGQKWSKTATRSGVSPARIAVIRSREVMPLSPGWLPPEPLARRRSAGGYRDRGRSRSDRTR